MNSVTDHFHHALLIIRGCTDQSRCSVSQRLHGIIKMGHMMRASSHCLRCRLIVCTCMSKGNTNLVMYFVNKLHSPFYIRSQSHKLHHIAGISIQLTEKFCVRFADIAFYMGTFFLRVQERSLHINASYCSTFREISYCLYGCEDFLQFLCRKCHGGRTIGSHSMALLIFQNNLKPLRVCIGKVVAKCTVAVYIHQSWKHLQSFGIYYSLVCNLCLSGYDLMILYI